MYINQHTVVGFLAADAEFHLISKPGEPLRYACNFRIAVTKRFTSRGESRERTTWFAVKFYLSERGEKYYRPRLTTGEKVFVQGEHLVDERKGPNGTAKYAYIEAILVEPMRHARVKSEDEPPSQEETGFYGERYEDEPLYAPPPTPPPPQAERRDAPPHQQRVTPRHANEPQEHNRAARVSSETRDTFDPANW